MKDLLIKFLDYKNFQKLSRKKKILFYLCSFYFIIFAFIILIGKNPFSLLIPFSLYDSSSDINSKSVKLYAISQKNELTKIKRNLILGDNFYTKVYTIIGEIAKFTLQNEILEKKDTSRFMKKLTNLQTAVLSIWKYQNTCIIYLREKTIIQIISNQVKNLDYVEFNLENLAKETEKKEILKKEMKFLIKL